MSKNARRDGVEEEGDEARPRKRLRVDDLDAAASAATERNEDPDQAVMDLIMEDMEFRESLPVPDMVAEMKKHKATWVPAFRARFWRHLCRVEFRSNLGLPHAYRMVLHGDRLWEAYERLAPWSSDDERADEEARYWEALFQLFTRVIRVALACIEMSPVRAPFRLHLNDEIVLANVPTERERAWITGKAGTNTVMQGVRIVAPDDQILEHNEDLYSSDGFIRFLGPNNYAPWPLPGLRTGPGLRSYDGEFLLHEHRQYHVSLNNWLMASYSPQRRYAMQRHMFRYIPTLDKGRQDYAQQCVFLSGSVTIYRAPDSVEDVRIGPNGDPYPTMPESNPRLRVAERIDSAGAGPDHYELPWIRAEGSVNVYKLKTYLDSGTPKSIISFTRPCNEPGLSIKLSSMILAGLGRFGERIARHNRLRSARGGSNIVFVDVVGARDDAIRSTEPVEAGLVPLAQPTPAMFEARVVFAGNVFTGTTYEKEHILVSAAMFTNSIHLDNFLDWIYRIADETQVVEPQREAHYKGLATLCTMLGITGSIVRDLQLKERVQNRPFFKSLLADLWHYLGRIHEAPLAPGADVDIVTEWAFCNDHDGFMLDLGMNPATLVRRISEFPFYYPAPPGPTPHIHFTQPLAATPTTTTALGLGCCSTCGVVTPEEEQQHHCPACGLVAYCSIACRTQAWTSGNHKLYCIRLAGGHFDLEAGRESPAYRAFVARWEDALRLTIGSTATLDLDHWQQQQDKHGIHMGGTNEHRQFQRAMQLVTDGRVVLDASFFLFRDSFQELDARSQDEAAGVGPSLLRQLWYHLPEDEKHRYLPQAALEDRGSKKRPLDDADSSNDSDSSSSSSQPTLPPPAKRQRSPPRTTNALLTRIMELKRHIPPEIKAFLSDYTPASIATMGGHLTLLRRHRKRTPSAEQSEVSAAIDVLNQVLYELFAFEVQAPLALLVEQQLIWVAHYPRLEFWTGTARDDQLRQLTQHQRDLDALARAPAVDGAHLWRQYALKVAAEMRQTIGEQPQQHWIVQADLLDTASPVLVQEPRRPLKIRTAIGYPYAELVRSVLNQFPTQDLQMTLTGFVALFPRAVLTVFPDAFDLYLDGDQAAREYGTLIGGRRSWMDMQFTPDTAASQRMRRRGAPGRFARADQEPAWI